MASTRIQPWREAFRAIFTLAGDDWRPTSGVRTTLSKACDRLTFVASFQQPDGTPVKLTVKSKLEADGKWYAVAQHMDLRLTFGGRA